MFGYPFALWRIYLHPAQHRVAYGSFTGPARVTGGPGTGKTVTALHRAKHLATRTTAPRSVLLTTFTKTLAESLETNLTMLVEDQRLLDRIDVRNVDQLANKLVTAAHGRLALLPPDEEKTWWHGLIARHGLDVTETFLREEWRQVILAYETICVEAARLLSTAEPKPYRPVIVDEAQDLSPWQWRMLRAAVPAGPNDLFIAGDTHQRIYTNRVSLKRVGIDVTGRSERLKVNYRTTAEILGWSLGVLRAESIDDMNGHPRRSLRPARTSSRTTSTSSASVASCSSPALAPASN